MMIHVTAITTTHDNPAVMAPTSTLTYQDNADTAYLSSSLSSLSRSRSTNSLIVRTYKEATSLYLTKRFKEALEVLEPIITVQTLENDEHTNGNGNTAAPIAQSSKTTRTKVWVFYLSLLHAIIDLGPEEGKLIFGSSHWKALASRAREGTVWQEIIQSGYGGEEASVDADVAVNLATLLLGHMNTQKLNQQRLETWLATNDGGGQDEGGQSTPKTLASRLKVLELYTLHVLPANEEWEYAKQFIEMSDSLDEERREAFLHALEDLKDEKDGTAVRERELAAQREREMDEQRRREEEEARRVEEETGRRKAEEEKQAKMKGDTSSHASVIGSTGGVKSTSSSNGHSKPTPTSRPGPRTPAKKPLSRPPPAPPATLYRRASYVLQSLQSTILQASRGMGLGGGGSSFALFRFLMFMLAFVLVAARRDVRVRVRRMVEEGWGKVRRTVGMGVKVSYL
ncbi:hypothetical protein LTR97_003482 [Elasticomyces elasticus]|uniref:Peroxin 26 n=1 Tax=Elasticomyces elasticus TaxID=574655 RepID=A0AAN7W7L9_9PEZI|nr:hypothetical protein LTR97_003482 [Elasticomyces elasticus]